MPEDQGFHFLIKNSIMTLISHQSSGDQAKILDNELSSAAGQLLPELKQTYLPVLDHN